MILTERINKYNKEVQKITSHIASSIRGGWKWIVFDFYDDFEELRYYLPLLETIPFHVPGNSYNPNDYEGLLSLYFIHNDDRDRIITFSGLANYKKKRIVIKCNINFKEYYLSNYQEPDWNLFYLDLLHIVGHEYYHILQRHFGQKWVSYDANKEDGIRSSLVKDYDSLKSGHAGTEEFIKYNTELASEIEAELKSYWFLTTKLKKTKRYREDTRGEIFLDWTLQYLKLFLNDQDAHYILNTWRQYAKIYFPYIKIY